MGGKVTGSASAKGRDGQERPFLLMVCSLGVNRMKVGRRSQTTDPLFPFSPRVSLQTLTIAYNRQRQAKITQELAELVAGAACASG